MTETATDLCELIPQTNDYLRTKPVTVEIKTIFNSFIDVFKKS